MFTPGQVSDMLEVPPSTLRRYVKQFETHLSESATKKRGRHYTENAAERRLEALEAWSREPWYRRVFASPPE